MATTLASTCTALASAPPLFVTSVGVYESAWSTSSRRSTAARAPASSSQQCSTSSRCEDATGRVRAHKGSSTVLPSRGNKRKVWKGEPLVYQRMTRPAMVITKQLKMWLGRESDDDGALLEMLKKWVADEKPARKDWLDVLKEFDTSAGRDLLLKLSEWSFTERWFEVHEFDYTKLLERYGKAGRIENAEKLLAKMETKRIPVDMVSLTVMLGLYGKARLMERAVEVFDRIQREGFTPDTKVYNNLIKAYGYSGLPSESERVLEEMITAGVQPTMETYCCLINGYARAEQANEAQRIFNLMLSEGMNPNAKAYTALLDAYGKVGDPFKARAIFDRIGQAGFVPDDRAICLMIAAYEKRELIKSAVGLVVQLENAGIRPGRDSLTSLLSWFTRVGLLDEAEELFQEIVEREMRMTPKMYSLMSDAYVKASKPDNARNFQLPDFTKRETDWSQETK